MGEAPSVRLTPQIPWLRVFVEGVVIVGSILLAFGIDASEAVAQTRSDTVAVIRAALEHFAVREGPLFLAENAPGVVLEAADLVTPQGRVRRRIGDITVCEASLARGDDNVGMSVSVSFAPSLKLIRRHVILIVLFRLNHEQS